MPDAPIEQGRFSQRTVPVVAIPTGAVGPGEKRDIGTKHSNGEIVAFIDDDVYPVRDWLKNAVRSFSDPEVAAVGGPAVTPSEDGFWQKASGAVFSSILVSGQYVYRYLPTKQREIDDYPSCNLLVRKSVMEKIGGFNTDFWPGEDTKLCLDIKNLGVKIIYDPDALVYHHRRKLFGPHLKQVASYALHRGYFVKRYPGNSLKLAYFLPSFFVLGLLLGVIFSPFLNPIAVLYSYALFSYLILVLIFSIQKDLRLTLPVFVGIILTHLAYGIYFLKGLLTTKLKEEK